ncbi:hypothetical protein Ocin01_11341 [Orchesella cincta]|uniref:Uncharacterized protein n=1 Tax=Orchesella cincta TaxID=48709 RepID=A0A1D2MR03_ORCCI|nr:hypothetical protein Ocin01_11341 [Orchesella cincta]
MRCFVLLALFGIAYAFPAEPRDAEVIQITDKDAPIVLNSENEVLPRNTNASDTPISPSPIPESQAITTEKLPESNTPNLVPTVVDISTTPNPVVTQPPFPANASTTAAPEEEDEESDEDESEEEADEEDDDDEDEEEEDAEEEEDEEEDDVAGKTTIKKNRVTRQVDEEIGGSVKLPSIKPTLGSVVIVSENVDEERSDEEDSATVVENVPIETLKIKPNLVNGSRLQSVPARSPTNEDDELDNKSNE